MQYDQKKDYIISILRTYTLTSPTFKLIIVYWLPGVIKCHVGHDDSCRISECHITL